MRGKNAKLLRKFASIVAADSPHVERTVYRVAKKNFNKLPKPNRSKNLELSIKGLLEED